MLAWTAPWNASSGLIAAVVSGKPLAAGSSLSTLVPLAVGPTPAIDTDDDATLDTLGASIGPPKVLKLGRRKARNPKPSEAESARRTRLLKAFLAILLLGGSASGSCFAGKVAHQDDSAVALDLTSLALEGKRTATLACRLSSLTAYLGMDGLQWPPSADSVYEFFGRWATASHAASRSARFLEALRFLKVLGFDLEAVTESPVLVGWSIRQTRRLGLRSQAAALDLSLVAQLEQIVALGALDLNCLLVAGGFLLMILLRARFSDLASWTGGLVINSVSVQVQVVTTKTSGRISDRLALYLVGPRRLLTDWDWLDSWLKLRRKSGLTDNDPVFPAKGDDGWDSEPATLQGVNRTLKHVFTVLKHGAAVTTHSAKATLLHWCALYGLSAETRARLGYHVGADGGSVRAYSRDRLAKPVAELTSMLDCIRRGEWSPDDGAGPRTELEISPTAPFEADGDSFPSPTKMWGGPSLDTDDDGRDLIADDDERASESSSCDSTDSESDEEVEDAIVRQAESLLGLCGAVDCRRFMNPAKDGKQHGGRPGSLTHTRCGLAIPGGSNVSILVALASGESETSEASSLCKKCFRESKLS